MKNQVIKLVKYSNEADAFNFQEEEIPAPLPDELQIEVTSFGLNYADVMARRGLYGEAPPLPCVLGYEVVGKVIAQGTAIKENYLQKRVVAFTLFGGYSKLVNTKVHGVVEIGNYDGHKALCLATQYVTAYYMSHVATTIFEGDNVLIHAAAGGVGTALLQLLKDKNVNLIAKTGSDAKFSYLEKQGASHIVNYNKSDYSDQLKSILGKSKLDVSFNPVGGTTFKKDFKLLGYAGRMLLFGGSSLSNKWGVLSKLNFVFKMGVVIPIGLMMQSKSLIGINMLKVALNKPKVLQFCLAELVKLAIEEKIDPQIGSVYAAKDIVEAHDFLASGKSTGKVVVDWEK